MEYIFNCRKCGHILYVNKNKMKGLEEYDCPNCGEEGDMNWIFDGINEE